MKRIELFIEWLIFSSRWLLAPFYLGLVLAIGLLLVKFIKEFISFVPLVFYGEGSDVIIGLLSLIDVVMIANLVLIIVLAGYENFVSRIETGSHEDRPNWMGHVGFAELKMKLIGSIVAISGIELLKAFMYVDNLTTEQLAWKVGIHMTFVVSGVLFAVMDRVAAGKSGAEH
ncbi:TIGR00645 family protein [Thiohalocapsa marina]|uniref:UPF0114 protein F2Q65_08680 n=1 Tax=Thiohalocapsa marina TaxID=424902 RepID=A0A5M8FSP9_9GAMM|nr:TIGR00645 family protein [Thiohalocapsa marina]KAA6185542.1 TIGR00645 family protein [Thiohalocapsa marina]